MGGVMYIPKALTPLFRFGLPTIPEACPRTR